jgi:CRISPR-associated protein Csd1
MIYRALIELAEREGLTADTSYEPKPVHYLVHLGRDGAYLGYTAPREPQPLDQKGRPKGAARPVVRPIPRRSDRTRQDQAEFLVDKAEYVFGIDPVEKRSRDKLATHRALFRGAVEEAASKIPSSAGLRAVVAFLQRDAPAELQDLLAPPSEREKTERAGALFAFVYEPDGGVQCVHDEPAVRTYWRERLEAEGAERGQCLVTGKMDVPLTRLHAKPKGIPPISKTRGGVRLTSVNEESFQSYGLEGIGGAPISRDANMAIKAALNRLLDPRYPRPDGSGPYPKQHEIVSPDTVVVYWSKREASLEFLSEVERHDPEAVGQMLRTPSAGRPAALEDPTAFYALILSGSQGRAIIRSFIESTVREVAEAVDRYREETRIVRPYGETPGGFPLGEVRRSLVPRPDPKNPDEDLKALPPALATDLYLAVLRGRPLPATVLEAAVRRNRAQPFPVERSGRRDEKPFAVRCSLLKVYLRRNLKEDVSVSLDTSRTDRPYRLGRLLAVIDKLQQDALEDVNASVVDRFYGSASATPESVFPTLLRRTQHHMGKLRKEKPGLAVVRDQLLQEIVSEIQGFPKTMRLEDQAMFALGFYHQRQAFFTSRDTEVTNG